MDKRTRAEQFPVGTQVLHRELAFKQRHKLANAYRPALYTIVEVDEKRSTYLIRNAGGLTKRVNRSHLRKCPVELKSEELKSEELKSEELKSEELKSEEPKKGEDQESVAKKKEANVPKIDELTRNEESIKDGKEIPPASKGEEQKEKKPPDRPIPAPRRNPPRSCRKACVQTITSTNNDDEKEKSWILWSLAIAKWSIGFLLLCSIFAFLR